MKIFFRAALLCTGLATGTVFADVTIYEDRVNKRRADVNNGAHATGVGGESIDMRTGEVSLRHVDIDLPGNSALPVQLVRSFKMPRVDGAFNDWNIELPNLSGVFARAVGWQIDGVASPLQRCSAAIGRDAVVPPYAAGDLPESNDDAGFYPEEYWHGYQFEAPGGGSTPLLLRPSASPRKPADGRTYPWVASGDWMFYCIALPGSTTSEGFAGVSPEGVTYLFDVMASSPAQTIKKYDDLMQVAVVMRRKQVHLLPSRATDRFGNWVTYSYSTTHPGRVSVIEANDGRRIDIAYDSRGRIQSAIADGRTWSYAYEGNVTATTSNDLVLKAVTRPDGSQWTFDLKGLGSAHVYLRSCPPVGAVNYEWGCDPEEIQPAEQLYSGAVMAPSGSRTDYQFKAIRPIQQSVSDRMGSPRPGLYRKTVSGPGLPTATWTYSYSHVPTAAWANGCGGPCPTSVESYYVDPRGDRHGFVHGVEAPNQGLLLSGSITPAGGVTPSETIDYTYNLATGQAFAPSIGSEPLGYSFNYLNPGAVRPLSSKVTTRNGATFSSSINTFDSFARPLSVNKASSLGNGETETIEYYDDLLKWVLGQVKRNTVNSLEVTRTEFDSGTALPWKIYSFGQHVQTLTYTLTAGPEAGTLKTVNDALNHTTTLSNWKRGVPQSIQHPDSTAQSAAVDGAGLIRSVTDESGSTTRYDYDSMGRLSLIDFPDGDSVDWTSTGLTFGQVSAEEYGIAAGHWKHTITTGNQRKTTYFDAMLRPLIEREEDLSNAATVRVNAKRYDHEGRVTDAYYPQSSAFTSHAQFAQGVHTKYDALGRVVETKQDAEGGTVLTTKAEYLPGLETLLTDPRNQQTRIRYAALDQPTTDYPVKQFLPEGVEVTIVRDTFFKPTQVTRSGPDVTPLDRFYIYDAQQRLCRLFEPETGSNVTAYDAAGNVTWSAQGQSIWGDTCGYDNVAANSRATHYYDPRNRQVLIDYPAGTDDVTVGYELTGEVRLARLGSNTEWRYIRNKRGLITREALSFDGDTRTLDYAYTPLAALSRVTYPGGRAVDYAPNALGQPTQAGSYVTNVSYSPDGDARSFRYANGIAFSSSKNERRLPNNLTYAAANGSLLYSQDLSYDPNANLSQVTDLAGSSPSRSKTMGYDGLNRLTSATAPALWGTETYKYDSLDNIRQRTKDGQVHVFSYDPLNRLSDVTIGGSVQASYWYDLRGNVTGKNTDTLSFDLANRLQSYNGRQNYQYDAWGRRVRKTSLISGADTLSIYSQGGQLMREHDSAANTVSDYVYLGQKMVAKVSDVLPKLTAPGSSGGGHTLTWEASPTAVRYIVEESTEFGAWTQVYSGTDLSWSAGGRGVGTYRYRIRACTADGVCRTHTSLVTVKVGLNLVPIIYELLLS